MPRLRCVHERNDDTRPRGPLLLAALAVTAGVLAARTGGVEPVGGTAVLVAALAMLAVWRLKRVAQGIALLALASVAAERASGWAAAETLPPAREPLRLEACAERLVPTRGGSPAWTGLAWTLDDAGESRRLRLVLQARPDREPPEPGTRLRLEGTIRSAGAPRNPGEEDPRRAEADLGLEGGVWAQAWTEVGRCDGFAARAALARGRRSFGALVRATLPEEEAGLALALAAGDGSQVAPADFDAFQATGTVHVLSVSGMHLALVTAMVFLLVRGLALLIGRARASALDLRAAAAAAALGAAALYSGFAGMSLATARALVATALVCSAALLGGGTSAWNAWALGIVALLLVSPTAVRTPTFALSFLAVAGMLAVGSSARAPRFRVQGPGAGAWVIAGWTWIAGRARVWPGETARMTAGAAAATAPAVAAWFGRVPALGLIANAAAIPLFTVALVPLLMAAAVLPVSETAARALISSAWPWLWAGRTFVAVLAALPACWLDVGLSPAGAAGLSLSVFATLLLRGHARLSVVFGGLGLAIAAAVLPGRPPDRMEVTFLAAGQGDAAVVRFASGGVLVVDTGPDPAGRRVLVPFLRSLGVRRVDAVAISHAHPDHTGGLADLVRAFPVEELWLSGPIGADPGLDAALAPLEARGTRVRAVGRGTPPRRFGEARVQFLAGEPELRLEAQAERNGRNDRSLVLRIDDGTWSVLMTGDLEQAGERRLVDAGVPLLSDVVKAPHHGSATSSSLPFVRAVAPRLTIAPTGLGNRFGFPADVVEARWRAAGSGWLDTAAEGAITLRRCDPPVAGAVICARSFVDRGRDVGY